MKNHLLLPLALTAVLALLSACAGAPPVPDWQLNVRGAVERATEADLQGLRRVADAEWRRALEQSRRTADPARVARVGLVQCAVQHVSLAFDDCAVWRTLATEADPADQAYGRFLSGRPEVQDIPLLPAPHQPIARLMLADAVQPWRAALTSMPDPLSRLVAASALLHSGLLDPDGVSVAVDTASEMGWRRPLAAWLALQVQLAQQGQGQDELAQRAQRRLQLLLSAEAVTPRVQRAD